MARNLPPILRTARGGHLLGVREAAVLAVLGCLLVQFIYTGVPAGAAVRPTVSRPRVPTFIYNAHGEVATATNAAGNVTTYHYGADGELLWVSRSTGSSKTGPLESQPGLACLASFLPLPRLCLCMGP